jgi:glutathione peroxidase
MITFTIEAEEKPLYGFNFIDNQGNTIQMEDYKGKTLLIVNTASLCGMTPQYHDLQDLYVKYKDQGLEIIAFPCNQFGAQEPGTNEEIANFCSEKFDVTFKIASKIEVNGENAHPIYKYLTSLPPKNGRGIDWNFEKFVVDKKGNIANVDHRIFPRHMEEELQQVLAI